MLDISEFTSRIREEITETTEFVPSELDFLKNFQKDEKEQYETPSEVKMIEKDKNDSFSITPRYPKDKNVIALDSTSFILGQITDGLVCAIRASIIIKPANEPVQLLELYGPYLPVIKYQNSDSLYDVMFRIVYGKPADSKAPDIYKMPDRIRNLFERYLQLKICSEYSDSLILFDGSLIGDTIANPKEALENILKNAKQNNNSVVAISKSTTLTLQQSKKNILSLVKDTEGPICVPGIRERISQNRDRYLGDIYVVKLLSQGEPFRIDIDPNASLPGSEILEMVAGVSGDYGYPEELKLAHSTCILSSLEILECQSAAVESNSMGIEEDLRKKLFPLG